jgi:hypothetical protein
MSAKKINTRSMTSEISKKVNVQMKNFLELLAVLLDFHQQKKSLTWENMKNQLQLVIDNSISYNNHKSFALSDLIQGSIIAPMKMFSDMYSKFKELSLISFKTHNDSAIIEEKKKLKTLALKLEKHCKKSLDILFMVMAS